MFADGANGLAGGVIGWALDLPANDTCGARSAPNLAEVAVSGSERAGTPSARSANVVHVMPASWPGLAERFAGLLSRLDAASPSAQCLVIVPSARDATPLAAALRARAPEGVRIVPLGSLRRARRLVREAGAHALVLPAGIALALLRGSALNVSEVSALGIAVADELEGDAAALEVVLAEVPKGASKVLTAGTLTPFVEALITAHMHGARRLDAPAAAITPAEGTPAIEVLAASAMATPSALADLLELADAPSAAIVPADGARESAVRASLDELGYPPDSPLARIVSDGNAEGAALVVLAGAPTPAQLGAVLASGAARIVALVSPRERATLEAAVGAAHLAPFSPSPSRDDAAASEELMRDAVRRAIRGSLPAREMLALEPLLAEFDALVIAGALLRQVESTRGARRPAAAAPPSPPADRPRGSDDARGERQFTPRGDRPFKPRGDRPFKSRDRDDSRGDRPFKPRDRDDSRGDRPFKPRSRDSARGDSRGDRPFKPRGDRPFKPRDRDDSRGDRPFKPRGRDGGPRGRGPGREGRS
jgi:hypothetical protein